MYSVEHFPEKNKFSIFLDEFEAQLQYTIKEGRFIILYTQVSEEFEGKGLDSLLAKHVLDFLTSHKMPTVVLCPCIQSYMKDHPVYDAILDRGFIRKFNKKISQ